ncbi:MAG: VCBS repeat-containing protein, partial [Pirellulaceae bacterium]
MAVDIHHQHERSGKSVESTASSATDVPDGLRTILVTAEDPAGNVSTSVRSSSTILSIRKDHRSPARFVSSVPGFNLFSVKPVSESSPGPTPAVRGLTINIQDLPNRTAAFLAEAINQLPPAGVGVPLVLPSIVLRGDHSGAIPIRRPGSPVMETYADNVPPLARRCRNPIPLTAGLPATSFITLTFAAPLPDDRYTLTLSDSLTDPAGNALDGENNAAEPVGAPFFVTGDGIPGGDFVARFTVDSRPEVATWSQGIVYADINGNMVWDPEGQDNDSTNRDFIYNFGNITDAYFAGNFASNATPGPDGVLGTADDVAIPPAATISSGFDKVGSYGAWNGVYQFFLDTNDDGVQDFVSNMPAAFQVNGMPVAGNFFNSAADIAAIAAGLRPRDEIGLFDGQNWYLDVNGNNTIDANERFPTPMRGIPVVGDFNGDGVDDLATYDNNTGIFQFNLNGDRTTISDQLVFGFSGFNERPVAGDFNLDGTDDIAMWVPGRDGQLPKESGEFHFLVSDDAIAGVNPAATLVRNVFTIRPGFNLASPNPAPAAFSPAPLGNDLIAMFGDDFALPLFGNFDPPVETDVNQPSDNNLLTNRDNPLDVNHDGEVTPLDALNVINRLSQGN